MSASVCPMKAYKAAARVVAREHRMRIGDVIAPHGREARRVRRLAAYLAATVYDVPLLRLAPVVGVARSGLQRGLAVVEDCRDELHLDQQLLRLELKLTGSLTGDRA